MTELQKKLAALRQNPTDDCVSDLELDRLELSEASGAEADAIRARVDACPHCRERLQNFRRAQRELAERPDPIWLGRARSRRWLGATGAVVAVAAAALLLIRAPDEGPELIRLKGSDRFGFLIVAPSGELVGDEVSGAASPGDELQWRFRTSSRRFVAVIGKDASGRASVYYPTGPRAASLEPGPERTLPIALELDESLGEETIVGLICSEPVLLEPIRGRLQAGSIEAPEACEAQRYGLTKTERR